MVEQTESNETFLSGRKRKNIFIGILTLAAFFLILSSSDTAIEYMKKGLRLCAVTVIPSLFPFMVISELIVSSGIGLRISRVFAKPMRWLFGVGEAGAAAYLLGLVCGFPIGAKTAVSMYDRGIVSRSELERLLTFCNNPGSAFVISAVGVSLLGNKKVGIALYVCVILSSLAVGIVGKYLLGYKRGSSVGNSIIIQSDFSIKMLTSAFGSSALSMLTVCAYVVFFSAFVGCIGAILSHFSLPCEVLACIFGFFELSSGVGAAAAVSDRICAVMLCALFVGWSGLSVGFQIMSVCAGRDISFKPYFIAKAAQGVICCLFMMIAVRFVLKDAVYDAVPSFPYIETGAKGLLLPISVIITALFSIYAGICAIRSHRQKTLAKSREKIKKGIDKENFV
ncbi:MAG: hypothetical protein ACI3X1_04275 [Eubacteriales bacterium]